MMTWSVSTQWVWWNGEELAWKDKEAKGNITNKYLTYGVIFRIHNLWLD
jgi:hypothetical protein